MSVLLSAEGLTKHFPVGGGLFSRPTGAVKAVDGVTFTVSKGETLALVGESGCGKSTTGRLILRLAEPTAGRVVLDGIDITALSKPDLRAMRRRMQIVFQDPFASLHPRMTVGDILAEPLILHGLADARSAPGQVRDLLSLVGLRPAMAERYPHEFSGGQRQRIGVARALATKPDLIVCDEPVSALDVSIQAQVINLLKDLQSEFGLGYLFIAHDLAVVRHIADRVAVMYLGRIVELATKTQLYGRPRHPYTQALLAAAPVPRPGAKQDKAVLSGDVPSPLAPPPGCAFHTRCSFATERCSRETPLLEPTGDGGLVACHHTATLPSAPAFATGTFAPTIETRIRALRRAPVSRDETPVTSTT
ncbi:MAG: dipeptide ABC transporter ATP-binding protein [Alphaproteobacteria bacterium]